MSMSFQEWLDILQGAVVKFRESSSLGLSVCDSAFASFDGFFSVASSIVVAGDAHSQLLVGVVEFPVDDTKIKPVLSRVSLNAFGEADCSSPESIDPFRVGLYWNVCSCEDPFWAFSLKTSLGVSELSCAYSGYSPITPCVSSGEAHCISNCSKFLFTNWDVRGRALPVSCF